ncbi:MAG: cytochrome b/b6 domain-containing protein [Bryobacteraceae bacterium]|nr:cytochrome b/b6 domain-containing protein [Bryobacteraceae bacterium]
MRGLSGRVCLLVLCLVSLSWAQDDASDCTACHEQGQKLKDSAHAAVACIRCHEKHDKFPHPEGIAKAACSACHGQIASDYSSSVHGQEAKKGNGAAPDCAMCHGAVHELQRASTPAFRTAVPETCGMCHSEVQQQFLTSVHGKAAAKGDLEAAVCTDCHGEHAIQRKSDKASTVHPLHVRETCARCHGDVRLTRRVGLAAEQVASFDESFHGLALKSGQQAAASCASCHGFHNILPSNDRKSMIHPTNIAKTCGGCHPGAGTRYQIGQVHVVEGKNEPPPVRYARLFYLLVIPGTVGLMLLHHGGDWIRKLFAYRLKPSTGVALIPPAEHHREFRMHGWERVQHGLLALSFMVLVWTGFALKYPDAWWARPLLAWEGTWPVRGTVHRIAATVMVAVGVLHVVSLIVSRRLRQHWLDLFPKAQDVKEGMAMMLYNVGAKKTRPKISPHSYVEKVEYWAVVWGTAVMAVTGLILWFNNWALQYLPKQWIDFATTVHFYEALLASLAILVWHFYTVIFDPEVYPMDPAWLTGRSVRRRDPHAPGHHTGRATPEPLRETVPEPHEAPKATD